MPFDTMWKYVPLSLCFICLAEVVLSLQLENTWVTVSLSEIRDFANREEHAAGGYPSYRILNKIGETVYVGSNETLLAIFATTNGEVNIVNTTIITEEPVEPITCAGSNSDDFEIVCWNFIRVAEELSSPDELFVCGTNAFNRLCYTCTGSKESELTCNRITTSDREMVPNSPYTNPSTTITNDGSDYTLYAGLAGMEDRFQQYSILDDTPHTTTLQLQTDTAGMIFFKDPTFIGKPFTYDVDGFSYVFVLYREAALEYESHGNIIYPRIGRVCQNETTSDSSPTTFSSFVKVRLNCSIPEVLFPYYFNDIQDMVWDESNELIYAVFTSQELGPAASAMCTFNMTDILKIMDGGNFKEQAGNNVNRLWLPVSVLPGLPRPGRCNEPRTTTYSPLLDKLVPSYNPDETPLTRTQIPPPEDLLISQLPRFSVRGRRFTALAVDNCTYFCGTSTGSVMKVNGCTDPKTIAEITNLGTNSPVTGLELITEPNSLKHLVIATEENVVTLPLNLKCSARTELECNVLRGPYCEWRDNKCACVATGCTDVDAEIIVQPQFEVVQSCNNRDVILFCQVEYGPFVGDFSIQWRRANNDTFLTYNKHLITTTVLSDKLHQMKVKVLDATKGVYECVATNEGVTTMKTVTIEQQRCLTQQTLDDRCDEHTKLEAESTCASDVSSCDSCPGSVTPP